MTPRIIGALTIGAALLTGLVARIMSVNIMAGSITAAVLLGALVLYAAYRLLATGKGQHVAPRGYAEADELIALPCERPISRAATEHAPPWEPAPAFQAAPVIEPGAVTHGPRSRDLPEGYPEDYPEWTGKLSVACSRGECGGCEWPLCGCPCHADAPEAIIIGVGTISGGQVTSAHVAVLPPVQCSALPQWVRDILGADSVDGAMTEISRVAHSFESNFSKGHARQVRELLAGES